jgi:Tfp pilus assembly PilM family ATPase
VYERLRTKIQQKLSKDSYGFSPTDEDLDQVVKTKAIKLKQQIHDVSKEVQEAVYEVAQIIVKQVLDSWGNEVNRIDEIVLTGGGAVLFGQTVDHLFQEKKVQTTVVEDNSQMSNVKGFYLHGVIKYMKESQEDREQVYRQYVQSLKG